MAVGPQATQMFASLRPIRTLARGVVNLGVRRAAQGLEPQHQLVQFVIIFCTII